MISNTHILISLISFSIFTTTVKSSNTTSASESFVLSCGGSTPATDPSGRKWEPDAKFLTSLENSMLGTAQSQDPSLPSTIPYMTARIFTSESTYKFSVLPKTRHFIRLHFYPSMYNDFNASDSYLSVKSNGFTLLKNFSASITAKALTQAYIIKEFSVAFTQSGSLSLTFRPSKNSSVAFINGIEVVSMPEIFQPANMIGFSSQLIETEDSAFETMFRLNVGGQYISEDNDSTSLSRIWYDDSPYLYGAAIGITSEADKNVSIEYPSNLTESIAPVDVYRTARTMGPNPKVNIKFNLTWVFPVDGNFTYIVRLHFCEFEVSKTNQRVFDIFINNQTAQEAADVLAWAKEGVPVFKDFAVYVNEGEGNEELWVALHPSLSVKPEFYDAILNGLEIFKVNETSGNLASPNLVISNFQEKGSYDQEPRSFAKSQSVRVGIVVGGIVGGVAGIGLVVGVLVFLKHNHRGSRGKNCNSMGWLPLYGSSRSSGTKSTRSGKSSGSSRISMLGGGLCRHFSLSDIKYATNNFDESQVIGVGGFGKVYRGVIDGRTEVAIKRSNPSSEQGVHEFQTEIDLLSKLRHRHLVSLIGACEEGAEMILVYDYMANGTLREHIYKGHKHNPPLLWKQRLEICIGAARGLHYLHTGAKYTIIHRDVKTTNILLDEKWVAKVSDFGLSKTGPTLSQTHVSTVVKGSFGYLDPEYFRRQQLTDKSDVYSFGVVLFEVLCGRPVINPSLPKEQVSLADWALHNYRNGTIDSAIDQNVKGEISPQCLNKFVETAVKCLSDQGIERPSMGTVLWNLEFAMQLQDNPDGPEMVAEQRANDAFVMHTTALLTIQEEEGGGETEESTNELIFSQIVNPKGR